MGFKGITVNTAASADAHIFAEDDAAIYQAIFGGDGVMNIGNKFAARVLSNNKVSVSDGVLCVGGHIGRMQYADYTDLTIENGVSGKNRNDIIYAKFVTSGDVDSYVLDVRKGTAGSTAADPAMTQGNLYQGATLREYPLWRVKIEGLSIVKVEQLFSVIPTIPELQEEMKSGLSEVNRNLSVRYNPDTDTIQVYYNGAWKDSLKAQIQQFDIITNGKIQLDSGKFNAYAYAYSGAASGTATAPAISEITGAIQIKETWNQSEGSRYGSAFLSPAFDVTNWDKLVLDFDAHAANQYCDWYFGLTPAIANNYVTSCGHIWYNSLTLKKELDVSSLEGNYYLVAFVRGASNTSSYLNIKNVYLK